MVVVVVILVEAPGVIQVLVALEVLVVMQVQEVMEILAVPVVMEVLGIHIKFDNKQIINHLLINSVFEILLNK